MKVSLTEDFRDVGSKMFVYECGDCDCNCDCACPTDDLMPSVLHRPISYYLELTPVCNNSCPSCANKDSHSGYSDPVLTVNTWKTIIEQLASHTYQFKVTGGEPTLHPGFEDVVRTIDGYGVHFTLFTNARWEDPSHLVEVLSNIDMCDGLLISLHGPGSDSHDTFSGIIGSFEETVTNVRLATGAQLNVAISMVISAVNYDRVAEMLEFALSLGATHLVCNRLIGKSIPGITPTDRQLHHAVRTVEALRAEGCPIRFGNCIPQCFAPSSSYGCTAGRTFATIDPWGRVRPCNHTSLVAGSLLHEPMQSIWYGNVMEYWRSLDVPECHTCSAYGRCRAGCRAQALLRSQTKDPLMREPLEDRDVKYDEIKLYSGLRPVATFMYKNNMGTEILVSANQFALVPEKVSDLVTKLDGSMTLREVEQTYGAYAVDWVGMLHRKGMVSWHTQDR